MVNEVLTHSWEVGWAAAKHFASRERPDQPQAAVVGLWLGPPPHSHQGRQQALNLPGHSGLLSNYNSHTLWHRWLRKDSQLLSTSSSRQTKCPGLGSYGKKSLTFPFPTLLANTQPWASPAWDLLRAWLEPCYEERGSAKISCSHAQLKAWHPGHQVSTQRHQSEFPPTHPSHLGKQFLPPSPASQYPSTKGHWNSSR